MAVTCQLGRSAALALVLIGACARPAPPPACAPAVLADIEAAFVAEAVDACRGQTRATCTALPTIEAKFRAEREEWIACH